jgi:hypothetical protein
MIHGVFGVIIPGNIHSYHFAVVSNHPVLKLLFQWLSR